MKKAITMKTYFFVATLLLSISSLFGQHPTYVIETEVGNITIEVYPDKAPISANNFIKHVAKDDWSKTDFYRVVRMDNQPKDSIRIEVIQGNFASGATKEDRISHETTEDTGLKHVDGAISMARGGPGTASIAFFICVNDQPSLDYGGMRNPDGQGFAVFGQVIDGMDVVKKIQNSEDEGQYLKEKIKINKITAK